MLALIVIAALMLLRFDPWDSKNTLAYGPLWLAGAVLATGRRWRLSPTLAGALFLFALLMAKSVGDSYFLLRDYLVGSALLALLLALRDRGVAGWWLAPGRVRLGRGLAGFSYSLYLTHAPVIFLIRTALERRFGIALPIRALSAPALGIMLFEGLAALAVAWLFWLAFERHTGALRAAIRARLPRPPQASSPRAIRASQAS
jgi:peptidoglycan/LPS O-acetylase OafA/YrhL